MSEVKKEIELGVVIYHVKFEERFKNDPDWLLLSEVKLYSPVINLRFDYSQKEIAVETKVEPKILLAYHDEFTTVTVPTKDAEAIKNYAFELLWDYIKAETPLNASAREAIRQIMKGLETLVKAKS
jgi:hypothetical protein